MQGIRQVISTLADDGQEVMGPRVLVWHYPDNSIVNNTLLTVESNHFCVLKSRGAILGVLTQDNTRSRRPTGLSSALSHRLFLMALRAMREGEPSRALPEYLTKEIYLIKPPTIGKHDHDCECYFMG